MLVKLLLLAFVAFAIIAVWGRARQGEVNRLGALAWTFLWAVVATFVLWPDLSTTIAQLMGVGRGADMVFYFGIAFLFYAVFRLTSGQRRTNTQITRLVRELALRDLPKIDETSK